MNILHPLPVIKFLNNKEIVKQPRGAANHSPVGPFSEFLLGEYRQAPNPNAEQPYDSAGRTMPRLICRQEERCSITEFIHKPARSFRSMAGCW
jgi:hypothetical protein